MPPGNPSLFLLSRMTQLRESPCSALESAPCLAAQDSALNGSVAVAMHWRGKGSKFRLRELRKQEADMHKSMGRVLSLSRLLASGASPCAFLYCMLDGVGLRSSESTRQRARSNKQRCCQGAKLKLPPLCCGPAPSAHRKASCAAMLIVCQWH